jgi:hypothetical protein
MLYALKALISSKRKVKLYENSTLYDIKTLDSEKTIVLRFKKVNFCRNSALYGLKTLDFGKNHRFTL